MEISSGPLDNQTWQTMPEDKLQLCEHKNQTLEVLTAARHLCAKFDCLVAHQNFSLLAAAHDCETIR